MKAQNRRQIVAMSERGSAEPLFSLSPDVIIYFIIKNIRLCLSSVLRLPCTQDFANCDCPGNNQGFHLQGFFPAARKYWSLQEKCREICFACVPRVAEKSTKSKTTKMAGCAEELDVADESDEEIKRIFRC